MLKKILNCDAVKYQNLYQQNLEFNDIKSEFYYVLWFKLNRLNQNGNKHVLKCHTHIHDYKIYT